MPLKLVITQALLLLLAIAIEAFVLQRQLEFPPRKSIEYSTSINLLSTILGWLGFFVLVETFPLPEQAHIQMLNLIFFDVWANGIFTGLISFGFIAFFSTVFIEVVGFTLLQWLLSEEKPLEAQADRKPRALSRTLMRSQAASLASTGATDPISAILLGNAFSYGVILVLLVALQLTTTLNRGGSPF